MQCPRARRWRGAAAGCGTDLCWCMHVSRAPDQPHGTAARSSSQHRAHHQPHGSVSCREHRALRINPHGLMLGYSPAPRYCTGVWSVVLSSVVVC